MSLKIWGCPSIANSLMSRAANRRLTLIDAKPEVSIETTANTLISRVKDKVSAIAQAFEFAPAFAVV